MLLVVLEVKSSDRHGPTQVACDRKAHSQFAFHLDLSKKLRDPHFISYLGFIGVSLHAILGVVFLSFLYSRQKRNQFIDLLTKSIWLSAQIQELIYF